MRGAAAVLALAALLLPAGPAAAGGGDPDLPAADRRGTWPRVITQDDATTTSRCIGDPKTPLCAVETALACHVREQAHLCEIIGRGWFTSYFIGRKADNSLKYRVEGAWRTRAEAEVPTHLRTGSWTWQEGDVVLQIRDRNCWGTKCGTYFAPSPFSFVLRQDGAVWRELTRGSPRQ